MKEALIIFVRKPETGKVKTRLAASLGPGAALYFYKKLLAHTAAVVAEATVDAFVFYAGDVDHDDLWNTVATGKQKQVDADLGGRMQAAFAAVFEQGYEKVVIIGSDCPSLTARLLHDAFASLQEKDVVIGPASDGGYYLLGLKKPEIALFEHIAWSTASVYQQTVAAIRKSRLSFFALPVLTDVDEAKDLPAAWQQEADQFRQAATENLPR